MQNKPMTLHKGSKMTITMHPMRLTVICGRRRSSNGLRVTDLPPLHHGSKMTIDQMNQLSLCC